MSTSTRTGQFFEDFFVGMRLGLLAMAFHPRPLVRFLQGVLEREGLTLSASQRLNLTIAQTASQATAALERIEQRRTA